MLFGTGAIDTIAKRAPRVGSLDTDPLTLAGIELHGAPNVRPEEGWCREVLWHHPQDFVWLIVKSDGGSNGGRIAPEGTLPTLSRPPSPRRVPGCRSALCQIER